MNILPKKRWHVRTKQNIERVRRDEAKAAEEEKELKRRIRLAEQEARTDLLRKRAKIPFVEADKSDESKSQHKIFFEDIEEDGEQEARTDLLGKRAKIPFVEADKSNESKSQHINFFEDIEEDGGYHGGVNKEHEAEEKARKEKFEKDIGLLTYLGQSSAEAKGEVPWYLKSSSKDLFDDGKDEVASSKHKAHIDPLNEMQKYLSIKEKKYGDKIFKPNFNKDKHKQQHKEGKKDSSKTMSKVEELRAKRLKREAEEKKRSQQFLENLRKGSSQNEEVILDDRLRQYNSQFNPHLARNNQLPNKDYNII